MESSCQAWRLSPAPSLLPGLSLFADCIALLSAWRLLTASGSLPTWYIMLTAAWFGQSVKPKLGHKTSLQALGCFKLPRFTVQPGMFKQSFVSLHRTAHEPGLFNLTA